ncbi:uncharacterized protein DUF4169 [Palleronia aestuarii]|uniref:Uncharacterized protein DUF4169 n=1 Tax=Palleronia aestuarii TaxID=568105 RepID=A0A2W7N1R0_9RHOB|nr:DUF4169 family protein [Palleronia aestuarii]PZX13633.1 uncharacterized protein DUF4169 [Palleronia aestuarii]
MSEPVNLNRVRKARDRAEAKARADANAVKFGRNKATRSAEATRNARDRAVLEAHRSDDEGK